MRCKEQEIIDFWGIKIPQLKNRMENEYLKIKNDSDYYKNKNNRIYSLLSQTIVEYFDNILRTQSANKLKIFFETY